MLVGKMHGAADKRRNNSVLQFVVDIHESLTKTFLSSKIKTGVQNCGFLFFLSWVSSLFNVAGDTFVVTLLKDEV